ncbi:hypothetical protein GTH32_10685 [Alteromonas sp. 345S023]|uniref:Guanylate cyclase domain-containing protein n=1 Tax=Alteromonas profundi TaxID=2696062 RepID=A0A7X5RLE9_9ALTE|nr:adenylate/guanylate cyclase domain-containing protein [Alteromonas profundi]NDV91649.1 hypothetical protein [Alteromonas profundi]
MTPKTDTLKVKALLINTSRLYAVGLCCQIPLLIAFAPRPAAWINLLTHVAIALSAVIFCYANFVRTGRTLLLLGYFSYLVGATLIWQKDLYIQHFLLIGCLCSAFYFNYKEQYLKLFWGWLYAVSFCVIDIHFSFSLAGWEAAIRRGNALSLTLTCVAVITATHKYNQHRWNALKQQFTRARDLLYQSTPAVQLIFDSSEVKRQHFQFCCVLFADVKGYQQLVERYGETAVIDKLDGFYNTLDHVAATCSVYPLKTNGDEYMAVCGIGDSAHKAGVHVSNIVAFGEQISHGFAQFSCAQNWPCQIRIGIATGPVSAGMPNRQHGTFDVWGKTVNTAAMLEQGAEVNTLVLCPSSYQHLPAHRQQAFRRVNITAKVGNLSAYCIIVSGMSKNKSIINALSNPDV